MASQEAQPRAKKPQPITANPLFPAVVALWFAALFGLSSVAVRVTVIEHLVRLSQLDLVLAAAAPPLGLTARILVALAMATLGALIGMTVARLLVRSSGQRRERQRSRRPAEEREPFESAEDVRPEPPARRPISIHDELAGTPSLADTAAEPGVTGRRRALTAAHEDGAEPLAPPVDAFLPGEVDPVLELAGAELDQPQAPSALATPADAETGSEPEADLNAFADTPAPLPETPQIFHPVAVSPPSADENARAGRQVFGLTPVEPQDIADRQVFLGAPQAPNEAPAEDGAAETGDWKTPAKISVSAPPPLDDLGMADLALRLKQAMERRRVARSGAPANNEPPEPLGVEPAPAAAEMADLKPDEPSGTGPVPADLPAALRPVGLDDVDGEDDNDAVLSSLLPPRHVGDTPAVAPVSPFAPVDEDEETVAAGEDGDAVPIAEENYASLLEVAPVPPRPLFARIEEPDLPDNAIEPVVIFPGQTPRLPATPPPIDAGAAKPPDMATSDDGTHFRRFDGPSAAGKGLPVAATPGAPLLDPEETERSLRAALANLQRITGAA